MPSPFSWVVNMELERTRSLYRAARAFIGTKEGAEKALGLFAPGVAELRTELYRREPRTKLWRMFVGVDIASRRTNEVSPSIDVRVDALDASGSVLPWSGFALLAVIPIGEAWPLPSSSIRGLDAIALGQSCVRALRSLPHHVSAQTTEYYVGSAWRLELWRSGSQGLATSEAPIVFPKFEEMDRYFDSGVERR